MTSLGLISGDSHVVEPPAVFEDYLNCRWAAHAPRLVQDRDGGDCYMVPGSTRLIGLGLAASAGVRGQDLRETGIKFSDIRLGAWQPRPRLADQEADGVCAEVLYPTIGLFLLRHVNQKFVAACMAAYNTWIAEYCAEAPERLVGCGVTPVFSGRDASEELRRIRKAGLRGVLLPLEPAVGNYTSMEYDILWSTATELGIPLTFHALPSARQAPAAGAAAAAVLPLWDAQELLTGLVLGGVLHRWPDLRLVFAEFDAGWVPHFAQRLDHYFDLHYRWLKLDGRIDRLPSEYIQQSVYFTIQDDSVALRLADTARLNLIWASDFPHAESTWPSSRSVFASSGSFLEPEVQREVFATRVRSLYALS